MNWKSLDQQGTLATIVERSKEQPVLIFKHSTRCSVSFMAKKNVEWQLNQDIESYLLDLIKYRSISNEIAAQFEIVHQSPQAILIKNGKVIYHASHSDIDADKINELCAST